MTPDVTVVIPTRNRWSILASTLQMALGQEDVEHEVVVVDDASTDETPDRLRSVDDSRLRVVRNESNRGVAAARNAGIEAARGEWVAFMDDDDLWSPRKLRVQLDALASSGALFCYAQSVVLDEQSGTVTPDAGAPHPASLPQLLRHGNVIPGGCSNVVVRTAAARAVGGFDERLSMLADWDLWLRLADQGSAVACPDVLVAYRKHARNMTVVDLGHMDSELGYFAEKQRDARGMELDVVAYSRWLAGEAATPFAAAKVLARSALTYRSAGNLARAAGVMLGSRAVARAARRARAALGRGATASEPAWLARWR